MSELEVLKKKLQEASATASKYDKAEKERLELSKKVQLLEAQAAESKMLRDELLKLSNVNIELQTVKTRLTAAEEARDRALVRNVVPPCGHCSHFFLPTPQGDASRSSLMLSNLEGRLEQVEEDNESLSTALEQLRRRAAAQTTHHPPSLTVNTSSSSNSSKGEN